MNGDGESGRICGQCDEVLTGRFCCRCGSDSQIGRLTVRSVVGDFVFHVLHLETPLLRTVVNLTWRPGWVVGQYVDGERKMFFNPLKYCILTAAIVFLTMKIWPIDFVGLWMDDPTQTIEEFTDLQAAFIRAYAEVGAFFYQHLAFIALLTLPILALLMRLLFFWADRNFVEHYVFCLYVYGHYYLVSALLIPFGGYETCLGMTLEFAVLFFYLSFAAVQFLPGNALLKVFLSLTANVTFAMAIMTLAIAASFLYMLISEPQALGLS